MESKIQLMGRKMECKNNRWDETKTKKKGAINNHRRRKGGNLLGEVLVPKPT